MIAYYDLQLGRAVLKVAADNDGYGQRRQNGDGRGILQGGEKGVIAIEYDLQFLCLRRILLLRRMSFSYCLTSWAGQCCKASYWDLGIRSR